MFINNCLSRTFNVSVVSYATLTLLQFFAADLSVKVSTCNAGEMVLTR